MMQIVISMSAGAQIVVPVRILPDRVLQGGVWKPGVVLKFDPLGDPIIREAIEMAVSEGELEGDDFLDREDADGEVGFVWKVDGTPEAYCRHRLLRWAEAGAIFEGGYGPGMDENEFRSALPEELYGISPDELYLEFADDQKVWAFYLDDPVAELEDILPTFGSSP